MCCVARSRTLLAVWSRRSVSLDPVRLWAIEDCWQLRSGLERARLALGESLVRVPPKLPVGEADGAEVEFGVEGVPAAAPELRAEQLAHLRRAERDHGDVNATEASRDCDGGAVASRARQVVEPRQGRARRVRKP